MSGSHWGIEKTQPSSNGRTNLAHERSRGVSTVQYTGRGEGWIRLARIGVVNV